MVPAWLASIGWAVLAIVGLGSALIAWMLCGRLELEGRFHFALECHQEEPDSAGELFPPAHLEETPAGGGRVRLDGAITGHLRALGGLVQVDRQGLRILGYRLGRGRPDRAISGPTRQAVTRPPRLPRVLSRGNRVSRSDWLQLAGPARQALARSWRALRLQVDLEGEYGLDDPAATGMLAGALATWAATFRGGGNAQAPSSISYRFSPVFDRTVVVFRCRIRARPRPGRLVWPWLVLALHPQVRRLWWAKIKRPKQGG